MNLITNIKKIWKSLFKDYVYSEEEKDFINENKKIWKNPEYKEIGILVEGFLYSPTSVIEKARIAKAIEDKIHMKSLVLLRGFRKKSNNVYEIYHSFFIYSFLMWWAQYFNIVLLLKVLLKTINVYGKYPTGKDILSLEYNDIIIGDLLYDTLIRFNPGSYSIKKLNFKNHFRHIFRTLYSAELYNNLFKKYNIKAVVTSHNVYAEYGILTRLASKYGADVYLKDMDVFKHYDGTIPINEHFLKIKSTDLISALKSPEILEDAEKYLQSRFDGNNGQIDVQNAYKNKTTYAKAQLLDLYGLENKNNKNIFIMAHAFSDAPHVGEGLLFDDYYHWLEETLVLISGIKGINVFVKPHPSSYMWNESGVVENMVQRLKIDDIYILPKDFNTNSIKDIGDAVLTAQGTAGLEFSCFGIPAITIGKGYYSGFSIAIEPETVDEYAKVIQNLSNIEKLSAEIIKKAKVVLYLSMQHLVRSQILPKEDIFPGDDFESKYKQQYKEVSTNLKNGILIKDNFYNNIYKITKESNC